jgi:spore photoproduct lyase
MSDKFEKATEHTAFKSLHVKTQNFLHVKADEHKLTFQEIRNIIEIAIDLQMWEEPSIEEIWQDFKEKKKALSFVKEHWEKLKNNPKVYTKSQTLKEQKFTIVQTQKSSLGLGSCPVASPKTRCCNLMTLDAVESCGFDCSYCSIQSFYNENKITFDTDFGKKLQNLKLDKNKRYHIGTGQSSDSLMWGNRFGILDALFTFAKKNPNVLLELKTKSDNIAYLLENEVPNNILVTWSLNPQVIIDNEEHLSASLESRISSARALADKGVLVGFHFHPIVVFEGYEKEYASIAKRLTQSFTCKEVVLVSMGTLTFIKPVLKKLRNRAIKSKILQMPLMEASGKLSYPIEIKEQMFSNLYQAFKPWHNEVYFYMCMEDESLWQKVFQREYSTNEEFEEDMIKSYFSKIKGKV